MPCAGQVEPDSAAPPKRQGAGNQPPSRGVTPVRGRFAEHPRYEAMCVKSRGVTPIRGRFAEHPRYGAVCVK